ncbi:MAG: Uracil-DNA glycosylase, putative family 6 [Pseudolabrys sp.]|nr:Uracil-DNA glycosylase, putative family 6 [Pseudolabrys sp.]
MLLVRDMADERPDIQSLKALREAEAGCTRCPLYKNATQVVPGEGPAHARIMMVGEQPGDQEDLAGKPFVGPAGRVLDRAIADAGIDRKLVFVTNAVKHFKFEPRGKRRLHKRPNAHEIDRCHWWLDIEKTLVKPEIVVALGATAVRSIAGKPLAVGKIRGRFIAMATGGRFLATIHPSYLLRIQDEADKHKQYRMFVDDLVRCREALEHAA